MDNRQQATRDFGSGTLRSLARIRNVRRGRESSWDRTGGNNDYVIVKAGETQTLADIMGAGCITHIWMTLRSNDVNYLRNCILRAYWDGEKSQSIQVPIGDFFGMGHGLTKNFVSLPLQMSPEHGKGFNCFFAMPFADEARIEVTNENAKEDLILYYYIDYEAYGRLDEGLGRFHAQWRCQNPCDGIDGGAMSNFEFQGVGEFAGKAKNLDGKGNYVILEAEGIGHYIGCILNVHNLRRTNEWNWYGEGDDMIFIDDDEWPPTLHGTGTEDYFNTAWCPTQEYCAPYHGIIAGGGLNWANRVTLYRFHIEDPIHFSKRIRVTIEHGHANHRSDDYSSTAYWYQLEPHKRFPDLPSAAKRAA